MRHQNTNPAVVLKTGNKQILVLFWHLTSNLQLPHKAAKGQLQQLTADATDADVVMEQAARHQSGEGSVMTHKGLESACLSFLASCWALCTDSAACCSSSSCPLTCTSESES